MLCPEAVRPLAAKGAHSLRLEPRQSLWCPMPRLAVRQTNLKRSLGHGTPVHAGFIHYLLECRHRLYQLHHRSRYPGGGPTQDGPLSYQYAWAFCLLAHPATDGTAKPAVANNPARRTHPVMPGNVIATATRAGATA